MYEDEKMKEVQKEIMKDIKKKYIFPVYKVLYIDMGKKQELIPTEDSREKQENMREGAWIKDIFVHRWASKLFGQKWLMIVIVLKSGFNS